MRDPGIYLMSDDHQLDADLSTITLYLSGELTMTESRLIEDRLATDAAFRDNVQPVIDNWDLTFEFPPDPEYDAILARQHAEDAAHALPRSIVDAAWNRFQSGEAPASVASRSAAPAAAPVAPVPPIAAVAPVPVARSAPWKPVRSALRRARIGARHAANLYAIRYNWRFAAGVMGVSLVCGTGLTWVRMVRTLDSSPTDTPMTRIGWAFNQSTIDPFPLGTRRIEIGQGIVVTLWADSKLTFRPAGRTPGFVVNLRGEGTIEVSAEGQAVYLVTPAAHATLIRGRYSIRSEDDSSTMLARVDEGIMTVVSRETEAPLRVTAGQSVDATVGHNAKLIPPRRDLPKTTK